MTELDLQRVREAWRSASPADIVQALKEPNEYAPSVLAIIREEADRRGLTAHSEDALPRPTYEPLRQVTTPVTDVLRVAWRRIMRHEPWRRPLVTAAILGLLYQPATVVLSWLVTPLGCWLAYIVVLFFLCRPLRRYRLALLAPLVSGAISAAITAILAVHVLTSVRFVGAQIDWAFVGLAAAVKIGSDVGVPAVVLVSTVFIRNRFWPEPKPGYCRVCDYDLRGLPEPRCPECGTPFDPAEAGTPTLNEVRSADGRPSQQ